MVPAGALGAGPPSRTAPWPLSLTAPALRAGPSPRTVGAVRPASRPRTPEWLPRASTPPRTEGRSERTPSLWLPASERLGALTDERLGPLLNELRLELLGLDERLELLLNELRLELLGLDERLELLLNELRLELLGLDERLELLLNELRLLELLLDERLLLTELLWLLPPPRLPPPPRCAKAGVALSARPTITRAITFEVFISLLLSLFIVLFSLTH